MVAIKDSLGIISWTDPNTGQWKWDSVMGVWAAYAPAGTVPFKYLFSGCANLGQTAIGNAAETVNDCLTRSITPSTFIYLATSSREPEGGGPYSCAQVAAGAVDSTLVQIGAQFHRMEAIGIAPRFRLGWEMDGGWFPWSPFYPGGPTNAQFIAAYRHAAAVIRSQCLSAQFDYHFSGFYGGGPSQVGAHQTSVWTALYPGDDVVDTVGPDMYSDVPASVGTTNATRLASLNVELQLVRTFASSHGKPVSCGEWGLGDPHFYTGLGPGDQFNKSIDTTDYVNAMYNHYAICSGPGGPGFTHQVLFDTLPDASVGHRGFAQVPLDDPSHAIGVAAATQFKTLFLAGNVIVTGPTPLPLQRVGRIGTEGAGISRVPSAPTNLIASAGNTTAVLSWTASAANGSTVTSYSYATYDGGVLQPGLSGSTGSGGTSFTVTGLTNGHSYTFTVAGVNTAGTSTPSALSSAVTPVAGFTIVQSNSFSSDSGPSVSGSFTLTPQAGNKLFVFTFDRNGDLGARTVTGTGITFTNRNSSPITSGIDNSTTQWDRTATGAAGEAGTITFTSPNANNGLIMCLVEAADVGAVDKAPAGNVQFGVTAINAGSTGTLSQAVEVAFVSSMNVFGHTTLSIGPGGFTILGTDSPFGDQTQQFALLAYKQTATTAALSPNVTWFDADNGSVAITTWRIS